MLFWFDVTMIKCPPKQAQLKNEIKKRGGEPKRKKFGSKFPTIASSIKDTVCKYKEKLLSNKLKKYKCDTEDYQKNEIHHWEFKEQVSSSQTPAITQLSTVTPMTRVVHWQTSNHRREYGSHNNSSMESDFIWQRLWNSTEKFIFFKQLWESEPKRVKTCKWGKRASKHRTLAVDTQQLKDTVINISSKELSDDQRSLLSKGVFCAQQPV